MRKTNQIIGSLLTAIVLETSPAMAGDSSSTYDAVIDVACIYTHQIMNEKGGGTEASMLSKTLNAIALANQAFSDSGPQGTKIRFNLVAIKKTTWTEGNDSVGRGLAAAYRDEVGADISMLARSGGSYAGLNSDFIVTGGPQDIVVGHELGHALGAHHGEFASTSDNAHNSDGSNGFAGTLITRVVVGIGPGPIEARSIYYPITYYTLMVYPYAPNIVNTQYRLPINRLSWPSGNTEAERFKTERPNVDTSVHQQVNNYIATRELVTRSPGTLGDSTHNNAKVVSSNRMANANLRQLKPSKLDGAKWIIVSKHGKKSIHTSGSSGPSNINIYTDNNHANSQWRMKHYGGSFQNMFWLQSVSQGGNYPLGVKDGVMANGKNVETMHVSSGTYYYWYLGDAGNGFYYLENYLNRNYVLDIQGSSHSNGTNVFIWNKSGADNESRFELKRVF